MDQTVRAITVQIGNMTYPLRADEDEQIVRETAAIADRLLRRMHDRHPDVNTATAAVLALVNLIGEIREVLEEKTRFTEALDQARAQAAEADEELQQAAEKMWELKKDLGFYRNLCQNYEKKLAELEEREKTGRVRPLRSPLETRQTSFAEVMDGPDA